MPRKSETTAQLQRQLDGLCYRCDNPVAVGEVYCKDHGGKAIPQSRDERRIRNTQGRRAKVELCRETSICTKCMKRAVYQDFRWCEQCRTEYAIEQESLVAQGRCSGCGKPRKDLRWKRCEECREYEKNRRRKKNLEDVKAGICNVCHTEQATPGLVSCLTCRIKKIEKRKRISAMGLCSRCNGKRDLPGKSCSRCIKYARSWKKTERVAKDEDGG